MKLLLIDNNDSFTYNLFHLISGLTGWNVIVQSYQKLRFCSITGYDGFIISPGPGHPDEYTDYCSILDSGRPVFGVCLGMQIISRYFGGEVSRLDGCRHGITKNIICMGKQYDAAVYNSLYCSHVPDVLNIFAYSENIPMGLRHKELPIAGVQFHPESFLTKDGDSIIKDVFSSIGLI